MVNLKAFETHSALHAVRKERSCWKNIPMAYREEVLALLKNPAFNKGVTYRLLYRGPRRTAKLDTRDAYSQQSGCLMSCANRFSVYVDHRKSV